MKKVLNKGILVSVIMSIFLTPSNVFADNSKHSNEIQKIHRNINQHNFNNRNGDCNNWNSNFNNWEGETVNTFGNRFTQDNKVIISGMFNDIDNDEVRDYGFFIGNDKDNLTKKISIKEENRHSGFMDYEIDEFEKGKTYYYQAFIENHGEIVKGELKSFVLNNN